MARARNIKPGIMANERLAELPPEARLLFIYSWMLADREGRIEDRPKRIAAQALPYDRDVDVDDLLCQLANAGFITRYPAIRRIASGAISRSSRSGRAGPHACPVPRSAPARARRYGEPSRSSRADGR